MFYYVGKEGYLMAERSVHEGHRERLRNKFLTNGFESFEDHEIIELLLFYAIPRGNTNPIAHDLINRFGNLRGVLDATPEELEGIKGLGSAGVTFFKVMISALKEYEIQSSEFLQLDTTKKLRDYFSKDFIGIKKEEIHLVTLDDKLNLINCHIVARGGISTVPVNIRKMVQMCIEDNSETIVLAHNHPMGEARPSPEDIRATKQIARALKGVGIFLADHIVCSPTETYSMYESGFFCFEE